MLTSLTLPVLVVALAFPGFGFKSNRPAAPADSIPVTWKSPSLLALENEFVQAGLPPPMPMPGVPVAGIRLNPAFDPRRLQVTLDPDSGLVGSVTVLGDARFPDAARQDLSSYSAEMSRETFRRLWREKSRQGINTLGNVTSTAGPRSGLSFQLPSPLPKRVQSWLGPGGPALNVSGSENIKLSGQSDWSNQQVGLLGQRRSLFPTLNMQQDLDIRLEGQLSDRIRVNLLQNSANQIPLANRIAINYKGDEDDLIQALDLGNTNLTLPGTQFVSYSGRNEGLFGVKASSRFGPLDFTILASKQEGKSERASYAGGSARQQQQIYDYDYIRGEYFFLYDPNREPTRDIEDASIQVFLDDQDNRNDANSVLGRAVVNPETANDSTPAVSGKFAQLLPGSDQDYEILTNEFYGRLYKVLRLRRPVSGNQRLAVTYRYRDVDATGLPVGPSFDVGDQITPAPGDSMLLKLIRAPENVLLPDSSSSDINLAFFDTDPVRAPFNVVRDLELRNVYRLQGQRIDLRSLTLRIHRGVAVETGEYTALDDNGQSVDYVEIVGLDNVDESSGAPVAGHDGRVDGTLLLNGVARGFIDDERGLLVLPDPRPFAPRLGTETPFDALVASSLNRRARLDRPPGEGPRERNVAIYDQYRPQRSQATRYFMELEFVAQQAQGEINLGRGNLLEGSDVVTVGGQVWQRDRDYTIDYDLGRISLRKGIPPGQDLHIDYSYAPLFQQAGRTLLGSAFRLEGRDRSFGGAFMYESKGAQDLRPRLGEEPSRSLIGDLNTEWTFRPDWVTRLVDRLPLVRTTAPSELRVQAEVGLSMPNPNTRNEVFIDDMEGVRDAISLPMTPEPWTWASVPLVRTGPATTLPITDPTLGKSNAEIRWYSPISAVQEKELRPNLTQAEGANNYRQVLALSLPRRPAAAGPNALWSGITYPLDPVGVDLSRAQFIELWVNDFNDLHVGDGVRRVRGRNVKLRIDIGAMSEDQVRAPDLPPDGRLNTEDTGNPKDNQLNVTDASNEDTGVDSLLSVAETVIRDLTTAHAGDPEGDDFEPPSSNLSEENVEVKLDPRSWRRVNGTEDNKNLRPIPDTEDFNLNDILDLDADYYEWSIDLGDTASPYLVTSVRDSFPTLVTADNGWRRYRIPMSEVEAVRFGNPNLALARQVRVWLDDVVETDDSGVNPNARRPLVMLGGLDIVGSRWQQSDLTVAQAAGGTTATLNAVNTVDNADIYVAPFDPGETRSNNQSVQRREQSLALEFEQLAPDDTVEAYKTFSINEDYSRYGKLNWYVAGFDIPGYTPGDSLDYFVRFASDELGTHYYEYRAPVPSSSRARAIDWREIKLTLTDLSNLKLRPDFPRVDPIHYQASGSLPGETWIVHGRPSFTRLRRISFGLVNRTGTETYPRGQLWFNELRATDVARDVDQAQRVTVNGRLANLLSYNLAWNGRGADFLSVGESRGLGTTTDQFSAGGTFELQRFFEGSQISMPVSVNYSRNSSKPRFSAGDDVVRSGADALASETRSETRTYSTSYARTWSDRSNPLLRYTIGGITAGINHATTDSRNPIEVAETRGTSASINYSIAPRRLLPVPLLLGKLRLYPLPENFYWNYSTTRSHATAWERLRDSTASLRQVRDVPGRTSFIDFGASTRPFGPDPKWVDLFQHRFEGRRNLTLNPEDVVIEKLGAVNLGRVVSWRQNLTGRLGFERGQFLRPNLSWGTQYNQNNGPELSKDLSIRSISNGLNASLGWEFPFDRLVAAGALSPPAPARPAIAMRDSAGRDSVAAEPPRPRGPAMWRTLLSRLGNVQTDLSTDRSSSWTRLTGTPSPLYLLGLSSDPDTTSATRTVFGNAANEAENWRAGARSRISLFLGSTLNTRFDWTWRRNLASGIASKTTTRRFPDVEVEYGRLASAIKLDKLLANPRLRTQYMRSEQREFQNNRTTPTGIASSTEWKPLIGLTGDLKGGTRTDLRIERRSTERENLLNGSSITHDVTNSINLSLNRSFSRGQSVQFLGRTQTVNSTVNLGFTAVYDTRKGGTDTYLDGRKVNTQFPVDESRLSLNATGSYGFSSNVTGNLALGYGRTNDKQRQILRQNLRVELRAQFTF